ncbi:hypothetical protein H6B11_00645 [Mediterraneibacter glycyrrhizinilyticus]|nr:hypothetical protein [Mediterraneibacter glycyrrhizinilyticus]MBM6852683.1 hypothetical protein [Mediterraneibacter glycyrrhizinilyticus]
MEKYKWKYISFPCYFVNCPSEKTQRHDLDIEHPKIDQPLTVTGPGDEKEGDMPENPDGSN